MSLVKTPTCTHRYTSRCGYEFPGRCVCPAHQLQSRWVMGQRWHCALKHEVPATVEGRGGHPCSTAGSEVNHAELGVGWGVGEGNDRQQGRRKPTEHKAAQKREETQLLPGTRVWNTDLILAQLQDKHKESHGTHTHTLKRLLPPTGPLGVSLSVQWSLGWPGQVEAQKQTPPRAVCAFPAGLVHHRLLGYAPCLPASPTPAEPPAGSSLSLHFSA